jgi:hypothetical protein
VRDTTLTINVSVIHSTNGNDGVLHPDVYQLTSSNPNTICYGFTAVEDIQETGIRMQFGLGQTNVSDVAIVNMNMKTGANSLWEMERPYVNMYFLGCTFDGHFTEDQSYAPTDLVFEDCRFVSDNPTPGPGLKLVNCTSGL